MLGAMHKTLYILMISHAWSLGFVQSNAGKVSWLLNRAQPDNQLRSLLGNCVMHSESRRLCVGFACNNADVYCNMNQMLSDTITIQLMGWEYKSHYSVEIMEYKYTVTVLFPTTA